MKNILYVDDDKSVFDVVKRLLAEKEAVWTIYSADNADEAARLVDEEDYDLVILDVKMPGKNGLDLLSEWNEKGRLDDFYVLMVTGMTDTRLKTLSLENGATDLLYKPLLREDLIVRIESALRMKEFKDSLLQRQAELRRINDMLSAEVDLRKRAEEKLQETVRLLEAKNEQLEQIATHDQLTGVPNRRQFQDKLQEYSDLSQRFGQSLSCIMGDIDHFKKVNDDHGHFAGDVVLKHVASVLDANIRKTDIVARYGGEEFAILLPDTSQISAAEIAEKLRTEVEYSFPDDQEHQYPVTISFGVSTGHRDSYLHEELVEQSDKALYHAKKTGRNRVCLISELGDIRRYPPIQEEKS